MLLQNGFVSLHCSLIAFILLAIYLSCVYVLKHASILVQLFLKCMESYATTDQDNQQLFRLNIFPAEFVVHAEQLSVCVYFQDQVEELKSPVGTPQLSAKPTSGSVTVLTAIKEEEEEDNNQEELKQELVEQILEAMEEKRELQAQREALENKIGQYLAKKKVCIDFQFRYFLIALHVPIVRERPARVAKTST